MKISFLGAAKQVTGSNYLIETSTHKFLIDCGLYQGKPEEEALNKEPFEFTPADIDFVILTHCHIDHSGRIPLLVKNGYAGKIYCTRPTSALADLLLRDSGNIQEEEAAYENKKRKRAGLEPQVALYTVDDAINAIQYLYPVEYGDYVQVTDDIRFRFKDAGHLLGSAFVELEIKDGKELKKFIFSGDLGTGNNPMLRHPEMPSDADYIIMESTYGNKLHSDIEVRNKRLADTIESTLKIGGTVIIPSFAVGRTQEIIFELKEYYTKSGRLEDFYNIPIYIDSPMAVNATKIYESQYGYMSERVAAMFFSKNNPLQCSNISYLSSIKDSSELNGNSSPKVIISASGMCEAGRIRHHLKHNLWKDNTTVIFVGYQGEGTLGRMLLDRATTVPLLDENIKVNAKIVEIGGFSGHADYEDLLGWLGALRSKPKRIFIVHGEVDSIAGLRARIDERFHFETYVPTLGETVEL